jgi:ribosomal protein S18 acetylase RimI-like enzyme
MARSWGTCTSTPSTESRHARLHPETYILLVVNGNDGAVRFYERHGLHQEATLDGLEHYSAAAGRRAGVAFPPDPQPFELIVMRYLRR